MRKIRFAMMALVAALAVALTVSCTREEYDPYRPQPPIDDIEMGGCWRCYLVDEGGRPLGWNEFEFLQNHYFIFYDYNAENDELIERRGRYRASSNGFYIKYDDEPRGNTYEFEVNNEELVLVQGNDEFVFFNIRPQERNMNGIWGAFDGDFQLAELEIRNNKLVLTEFTNGRPLIMEGYFSANAHVMSIKWIGGNRPPMHLSSIWIYCVDAHEMFNSYNGGVVWERLNRKDGRSIGTEKGKRRMIEGAKVVKAGKRPIW